MNKLVISNNKIDKYEDDYILISDNLIIFKKSGDYTLEYVNSCEIKLEIILLDRVMVKLFIYSDNQDINSFHHYKLGNSSDLILFQFYCNKRVVEKKIIDLDGEKSSFYQGFSSISKYDDEYHIIVNHNNRNVCSDIRNKCIGIDKSRVYILVDSILMKGNTDCVMNQDSRILTLGDVDAKIVPNMYINEDSVEARHGSVIGEFKQEEIFYLMSRGISYNEAIMLLMKGFIFSNLVVDLEKRAMIFNCIQKLGGVF